MNIYGQVGPQGPVASGANVIVRQGNAGDGIVTELNGQLYEQGVRGNRFYAMNNAAQALSLSSTTTYTGLVINNPAGSGKNLVIDKVSWAATTDPGGQALIILGTSATVTVAGSAFVGPVSVVLGGSSSSVAKVGSTATLGANPTFLRPLLGMTFATSVGWSAFQTEIAVQGDIIVPPGQMVEFVAVTTAATGIAYISWTEINSAVL
jgi:hypothetical protein